MTSPEDLSGWRFLPRSLPEPSAPLSRRVELRLRNMGIFTAQLMNTSDGLDPLIQMQEEEIELKGRKLIHLLKLLEDQEITSTNKPLDSGV
jgi:hypothetical protein